MQNLGVVQFEVLPFERAAREAQRLPEPTRLTITSSPRLRPEQTIEFAHRLAASGHTVIPHLAARGVRDRHHLHQLLVQLEAQGIDELFVIGGDQDRPVGRYSSAREVLALIREQPHGVRTVGIAAYPEGHPLIDEGTLAHELALKSHMADYMTTQMCFDANALLGWLERTRAAGIALPLRIGMPGVVDRRSLLAVSVRIGVGPSVSFVRKQRGLRHLLRGTAYTVERLFEGLAPRLADPRLNVDGIHYFTLDRLCDTWSWARNKQDAEARRTAQG